MSENIIGHINIETIRGSYEVNHKVFVLTQTQINDEKLRDFTLEAWSYAYQIADYVTFDIRSLIVPKRLPSALNRLLKTMKEVTPEENWYPYVFTLSTKDKKAEIENKFSEWLTEEGYQKVIIEVVKLPKIKSKKRIPITIKMLEKFVSPKETKEKQKT